MNDPAVSPFDLIRETLILHALALGSGEGTTETSAAAFSQAIDALDQLQRKYEADPKENK